MPAKEKAIPNELIHESSPYLLQHAYNPVKWLPFGDSAFEKARNEYKLVLISVGYSACHWCHVMEHESFEDEQVAALMNDYFVCIKVDREERADVDMLYMQAVQLMTGQGGWPLNCFTLPDGRPFYGGTYFDKARWMHLLQTLADLHQKQPEKIKLYAGELTEGIRRAETFITTPKEGAPVTKKQLRQCVDNWRKHFDNEEGGPNRAPKFPLPSNYRFLLRYALLADDTGVLSHVELTLTKMAFGGINDQLHGGFARYSTDLVWKVPHFEKMLYDNSQLASLYLEAFVHTKNPLYAQVARQTLAFVNNEWRSSEGGFYSAYDADSEGVEGKYYVWSREELERLLAKDFEVFSKYFEINEKGYWEDENYILMRNPDLGAMLVELNMTLPQVEEVVSRCKGKLKKVAAKRVKPGLDDKIISSWNSMMCSAFASAYLVFGEKPYKNAALESIAFISEKMRNKEGELLRTYKNGQARISAFLDDYAFFTEALINCYLVTQDEKHLTEAKAVAASALVLFGNPESDFLFYTSSKNEKLIARNTETSDNVIPSSNAQMALNLFYLGHYFGLEEWILRSTKMLSGLSEELVTYGAGYSHWGCLALHLAFPFKEVAIVGKDVDEKLRALYRHGAANAIFAVSANASDQPLLRDRLVHDKTMIYVCENNTCSLPVEATEEALSHFE